MDLSNQPSLRQRTESSDHQNSAPAGNFHYRQLSPKEFLPRSGINSLFQNILNPCFEEKDWNSIRSRPLPQDRLLYQTTSTMNTIESASNSSSSDFYNPQSTIHGPQSPVVSPSHAKYLHPEHKYSNGQPVCHLFSSCTDPFERAKTSILPHISTHHNRHLSSAVHPSELLSTCEFAKKHPSCSPTVENFYSKNNFPGRYDGHVTSQVVHGSLASGSRSIIIHAPANPQPGRYRAQMTLKNTSLDTSAPEKEFSHSIVQPTVSSLQLKVASANEVGINQWTSSDISNIPFSPPQMRNRAAGVSRMEDSTPIPTRACFKDHRNFESPTVLGRYCSPPECLLAATRRPIDSDPSGDAIIEFGRVEREARVNRAFGCSSPNLEKVKGTIKSISPQSAQSMSLSDKFAKVRVQIGTAKANRAMGSGYTTNLSANHTSLSPTKNSNQLTQNHGAYRPVIESLMKLR
eukprot:GDKJ01000343.1.p1 GENE.GDKJ01000343.1~~GDKJ01000343.1.p1  ORF type:complete len:461 (-),score=52.57 GDKJ01000343.1:111-1493(-)